MLRRMHILEIPHKPSTIQGLFLAFPNFLRYFSSRSQKMLPGTSQPRCLHFFLPSFCCHCFKARLHPIAHTIEFETIPSLPQSTSLCGYRFVTSVSAFNAQVILKPQVCSALFPAHLAFPTFSSTECLLPHQGAICVHA